MSQVSAQQLRPRSREDRHPLRTRLDEFPRDPVRRWLLRLLFALPFAAAAVLSSRLPVDATGSVNAQLLHQVGGIQWGSADATWIAQIFPPISTLLAVVTPGGRLGLGLIGAVSAGIVLQKVLEIMAQRRLPVSTTVLLLCALAFNPFFFFTAVENLPAFLGLSFFGLALAEAVRFVSWGNTQSGFRAGILLMLATMTDRAGVLYVVAAIVAASFLRLGRTGQRGARGANILVIAFPAAAAVGATCLLNYMFLRDAFAPLGEEITGGTAQRLSSLTGLLTTGYGLLVLASVASAWLIALIVRRPGAIIVSALAFAGLICGFVLGLVPMSSAGNTFLMMTMLSIALIPTARVHTTTLLVGMVAGAQIAIAWLALLNRPVVLDWIAALSRASGSLSG